MALTTKENVLIIAPKLSTASDDMWNLILNDVGNNISSSVFGGRTEEAARYWVAHRMTLLVDSANAGASGPMTKIRVGDVMKEYANIKNLSQSESDFGRTGFGRNFLAIRNSVLIKFNTYTPGI